VTEILGHSQIRITLDAYTHVAPDTKRPRATWIGCCGGTRLSATASVDVRSRCQEPGRIQTCDTRFRSSIVGFLEAPHRRRAQSSLTVLDCWCSSTLMSAVDVTRVR